MNINSSSDLAFVIMKSGSSWLLKPYQPNGTDTHEIKGFPTLRRLYKFLSELENDVFLAEEQK